MTSRLFILLLAGVMALSGCALWSSYRQHLAAGFCGHGADSSDARDWTHITAPAEAERYRELARADPNYDEAPRSASEYWFALPSGERKYCLSALTRTGRPGPCDGESGVWWEFEDTESSPQTDGAQFWICVT